MPARAGGARQAALAALVALTAATSCSGRAWDPEQLALRAPALRELGAHRLEDITPYLLPAHGALLLFLCRWTTEAPLPVSLPPDVRPEERRALEAALAAWEGAGLGVRFLPLEGGHAPIEITLEEGPVATARGPGTGNVVADCRLGDWSGLAEARETLPAELVSASIRIARRTPSDARGRDRLLSAPELAGAALHELGHALGFQGHVRSRHSALTADVAALRALGGRVLEGAPFTDPTLRALYAVPSGTLLRRVPVEAWRTDLVDRMARLALASGLEGPFARVGDLTARVFWRDAPGREYGLQLVNVRELRRRPERVLVVPEARTRGALPRSRDLQP